jgi:hypothetical protein
MRCHPLFVRGYWLADDVQEVVRTGRAEELEALHQVSGGGLEIREGLQVTANP